MDLDANELEILTYRELERAGLSERMAHTEASMNEESGDFDDEDFDDDFDDDFEEEWEDDVIDEGDDYQEELVEDVEESLDDVDGEEGFDDL
jgi:hypothetical protein